MTGRKLGNYEIVDKLGEGGMGEVWRARDIRLNRSVAVKVLPSDVAGDDSRRQRFEQEARALGALNHPNIVAVYDVGQSDGQSYIVSELVGGESLRAVLERGPVPQRKLASIAMQIADAMAAAHALGIIHRDLKPENVMLTSDERVKVLDFGLAKQKAPGASAGAALGEDTPTIALSLPGMVVGTVGYMSPEQVRGQAVDARSDIFSFGCVLYEMATGRHAFEGNSAADVMSAVLKDDPPEMAASGCSVPPALNAIVQRCLEKDPARRFQSAADLAFALRSLSNITASQPAVAAIKPPRRGWWIPAAAAVGAVALFAAGYALRGALTKPAMPKFQRMTFREGHVSAARFSPDWKDVIYSASWDGESSRIYLSSPGNPASRDLQLSDTQLLSVSSKGDLAFLVGPFLPDGSGTLARNAIAGGQTRQLLEHVKLADWSPDGSEMAIVRVVGTENRLEYPIGKVVLKMRWGPFNIRISPDGQQIAYTTYANGSAVALWVVDRAGKARSLGVISGQTTGMDASSLCWTHDGKEILFRSFDTNDWNTIYAVSLGGQRRVVERLPGHVALYDVAADGRFLISIDSVRVGIRGMAPGETAERDFSCLDTSALKGISDDGTTILADALGESGGEKGSIYLRHTDGTPPIRLGDGVAFTLSPDGKWVSGYSSRNVQNRMFVLMPTGPGEEVQTRIPELEGGQGIVVGWLGDRNYIVAGRYPKGGMQIFAWDAASQKLRPVTPGAMRDQLPRVSPDRRQVLAVNPERHWCVYNVDGSPAKIIEGLSPHDTPIGWRADGHAIYIMTHHDQQNMLPISLLDLQTGKRTPWKEIRPSVPVDEVYSPMVTPDGRAYAYNYQYVRSEVYVAEGLR